MGPSVHVDRAVGVRPADVEDVHPLQLGEFDELDAVRRQELPDAARRLAPRVRLELEGAAIGKHRLRPRLERYRRGIGHRHPRAAIGQPDAFHVGSRAAQQHPAVRGSRRRSRRRPAGPARSTGRADASGATSLGD